MLAQSLSPVPHTLSRQERLLRTLETVLEEVRAWQIARLHIRTQIMADFRLPSPTEEDICATLEDYGVLAVALRQIADHLEKEVDETMNAYYDWLYD